MTEREWILQCLSRAVASAKKREARLLENKRVSRVRVIQKRDGSIVERPWPEAKPILARLRGRFSARPKQGRAG